MAKYKVHSKDNQITITAKLSLGEKINERELSVFNRQILRGCLRPRVEGNKKLIYTGPDLIELKKVLQKPLGSVEFFEIIAQMLELIKRIETAELYTPNLVMDLDLMFINEKTKELFIIYQPLITKYSGGNIYIFLDQLISFIEKKHGNNIPFIGGFKKYLANTFGYKPEDIELYIRREYPTAYNKIIAAEKGNSGFITNDRIAYANHYQEQQGGHLGTTLLQEGMEATSMLTMESTTLLVTEQSASIRRSKTDEERIIRTDSFTMGKGEGCDYMIDNNKAISRKHAVIKKRDRIYVITDLDSTNGSFVNGIRLIPEQEVTLHDGDVIRLADEDFYYSE